MPSLDSIATALKEVAPNSIIHSAIPKPEIDFVREFVEPENAVFEATQKPSENISIDDIVLMSNTKTEFYENLKHCMTDENINGIELATRGQSENVSWYTFRKWVVTASKGHGVKTRMRKFQSGGIANMFTLNQSVSGFSYVNPDLPALKYGRAMEPEAANCFLEVMKSKHKIQS